MCMFSEPIVVVHDTKIFARMKDEYQYLAYSMSFSASSELAMILPLPVAANAGDDAVSFVDLSECASFFEGLDRYFLTEIIDYFDDDMGLALDAEPPLVVHDVGSFEASFVPNINSFQRLDKRFTLSDTLWSQLPQYDDYGFAVFKLKPGREERVHPMAFRFPNRDPSTLFFPTLHIHDGTLPERALFDHALYCQGSLHDGDRWEPSSGPIEEDEVAPRAPAPQAGPALDGPPFTSETTRGLVAFGESAWKLTITGKRTNEDVLIALNAPRSPR